MKTVYYEQKIVLEHSIYARVDKLDEGYDVSLLGGCRTHIGAVSLAAPGQDTRTLGRCGHKETAVSVRWAAELAKIWAAPVCVRCGIHYDTLSAEGLEQVLSTCADMLENILSNGLVRQKTQNQHFGIL